MRREVTKPRAAHNTLMWKDAPDFVRLAAKTGALIVPFAAVGADDAYDVMMDTDEVLAHPILGPLALRAAAAFDPRLDPRETVMPLTRFPGAAVGFVLCRWWLMQGCVRAEGPA